MAMAFSRRSLLTVTRKSDFAQNYARVHGRDWIADPVDVGANAHGHDRNRESFADFQSGISIGIKKATEDEIGSKLRT